MVSMRLYKSLCYAIALLVPVSFGTTTNFNADPDFWNYHLTFPKAYHAVHKREISSSLEVQGNRKHLDHLSVSVNLHGTDRVLDLLLNRDLIPQKYFEKHQTDEGYVVKKPQAQDVELCHYNGKIRDVPNSWVAISTCDGISGMLYDGREIFYIERAPSRGNSSNPLSDMHVVYKHSDLKSNFTCGFHDSSTHARNHDHLLTNVKNRRVRRSANTIRGPYNSNRLSRYIELVLVIDTKEYKAFNEDMSRVHQHSKDIANIINSLYVPLNIFVALVGVVIWTKYDEITLETNGDKTLTSFLTYRKEKLVKEHPNDNAQLLTRLQFENGVVGKALKGPICTYEFSGGVNMDHSNVVGLVATTIAHEMGHNLGMEHDTENECKCPNERCIMSPSSSSYSPTEWSSCSREYLAVAFEHGMDYCLRNKPTSLFDGPVCGNNFVEPGEQCDCGLEAKCDNLCCDAATCMLHANASCATGECCDLQTCKPRTAGTECRSAEHECDLPEYCTGHSEYCPDDVFKIDGEACDNGKAYCYQGNCRSHGDQCRILWGPSGMNSDIACYNANIKGNRHGNCGYNRLNQSFIKCDTPDVYCGMLQCKHYNERLEFGMESVAILSHSFINDENGTTIIPCRTAIVDLGLNEIDPGLAPDGAKCAENHMCYNQRCLPVSSLRAITLPNACPENCNGNGICNSKGHCHCNKGFAAPYCDYSGVGGSEDSGPSENPLNYHPLRTLFFYLMLTVIPIVLILAAYSYYIRKSPSYFWKRNQRRTVQKSVQVHVNHDDCRGGGLGSTVQSLLSSATKSVSKANEEPPNSSMNDSLIGNFKGFSITPLLKNGPPKQNDLQPQKAPLPVRPAPPPIQNIPVATVKPMIATAAKLPSHPTSTNSVTESNTCRPLISSPVLDKTTSSTVNQLINKNFPIRPAPPIPETTKLDRPNPMAACVVEETQKSDRNTKTSSIPKEPTLTLNRIASFVSRSQVTAKSENTKKEGVPLKATKIDKDTLKSLVISDPIPLSEPSIPVDPLPLSIDQQKCVVMRAQSLRQSGNKHRPGIPSFGSVRLSQTQRPTSLATCSRPTSPPPCPPPLQVANSNLTSMLDDSEDNIYAIIEESPVEEEPKIASDVSTFAEPTFLDAGDGLLDEIVNEIQARNIDSIYSNDPPRSDSGLYENTSSLVERKCNDVRVRSSSSSEYLNPISSDQLKSLEKKSYASPLKVPEKPAPSFRPFGTNNKKSCSTPVVISGRNASQSVGNETVDKSDVSETSKSRQAKSDAEIGSIATKLSAAKPAPLTAKPVIKPNLLPKTRIVSPKSETGAGRSFAGIPKTSMVASMQRRFEAQPTSSPSLSSSSSSTAKKTKSDMPEDTKR